MGSREDDAWWDNKYAEAECYEHGEMYWDEEEAEWRCSECEEIEVTVKYGC